MTDNHRLLENGGCSEIRWEVMIQVGRILIIRFGASLLGVQYLG